MKPREFYKQYNTTMKQISERTGVSPSTLRDWVTTKPQLAEFLAKSVNTERLVKELMG